MLDGVCHLIKTMLLTRAIAKLNQRWVVSSQVRKLLE
jgi:hypothetical protein